MLTSYFYDKLVHLHTIKREDWQKIFDAGKKGLLACSVCGESVKLYLGLEDKPCFYHASNKEDCIVREETLEPTHAAASTEYEVRNGFRMPKSRSITIETPVLLYKEPKKLLIDNTTFQPSKKSTFIPSDYPYLHSLYQHGVFLDSSQSKAVSLENGPALVIAGAGSGKTRVLTTRTAFLIHEKKVDPSSIMLVTFTNKAALEMKQRLLQYPQMERNMVNKIVSGTFHSILYQILIHHQPQKWKRNNLLASNWQRELLLKESGKELQFDGKEFPFDAALQQIGAWKNSMLQPNDVRASTDWEEKVLLLYKQYEEKKNLQDLYDFDDMLLGGYYFFLENAQILDVYQKRFSHFLLDEFQDINKVQYEWIKLMSQKANSVFAVGDDDQAIYSFRGSDPKYLLDFEKDFLQAKVIILEHNYRSSHEIVAIANHMISKNKQRRTKKMLAAYSGKNPFVFYPYDEEEEATMIVTDILDKIQKGYEPKDFAVLFRTNTNSRAIFERLSASSLPFKLEQDAGSFYSRFVIKSMMGYLKLIIDPDHLQAFNDILPTLFLKKSVLQDVKATSILDDCSLLDCLTRIKTGFSFQEAKLKKIPITLNTLKNTAPLEAIARIEKELGFQDFIKKRGNEGNQWDKGSDDIRDLKVVAKKFTSITDFIAYTEHMIAMNLEMKKQYKDAKNTITLSTIHRAKGLEYKTVYVLGTVDGSIPHDYSLDAYRNNDPLPLEEERRLLYVGMTRAQEELYLSIPMHYRDKKAKPSRFLSAVQKPSNGKR